MYFAQSFPQIAANQPTLPDKKKKNSIYQDHHHQYFRVQNILQQGHLVQARLPALSHLLGWSESSGSAGDTPGWGGQRLAKQSLSSVGRAMQTELGFLSLTIYTNNEQRK